LPASKPGLLLALMTYGQVYETRRRLREDCDGCVTPGRAAALGVHTLGAIGRPESGVEIGQDVIDVLEAGYTCRRTGWGWPRRGQYPLNAPGIMTNFVEIRTAHHG
jgi:hypothetical protein